MMPTQHRRRQWRDRHEPNIEDLTLAFVSGLATASILWMLGLTLWR
jgi:hypothetical protein